MADFIFDQTEPNIAALPCGLATVGHSGCGPIALYNACLLSGKETALSEILSDLRQGHGFSLWGFAGSKTQMLLRWLKGKGFRVQKSRSCFGNDGVYILRYWFWQKKFPFLGSHYVAFSQTGDLGVYYNVCSGAKTPLICKGTVLDYLHAQKGFAPTVIKICSGQE